MVVLAQPVDLSGYSGPGVLSDEMLGAMLDAHRQSAFNLAYRLVRRPEDAADAVQDAFVLAVRATRSDTAAPRDAGRFRSWLLKIVANVALGQLRRKRSDATASLDELTVEPADPRSEQPLTALMRRERRGDVLNALLVLPDDQRVALTLREYQELSYDEIGELLGLDRAATTALLYRARCAFRRAYQGLMARSTPIGCPELAPLISAMLDEELDVDSWRDVGQHVADCRRCRFELRQLRSARRLHATIPLLAPPAGWSWTATLEAARTAGGAGAVGLAASATGLGAVVGPGTAAGVASVLAGASPGGLLVPIGGLLTGRMAGLALIVGLNLGVMVGAPAHQVPDPRAVTAAVSAPAIVELERPETAVRQVDMDGSVEPAGDAQPGASSVALQSAAPESTTMEAAAAESTAPAAAAPASGPEQAAGPTAASALEAGPAVGSAPGQTEPTGQAAPVAAVSSDSEADATATSESRDEPVVSTVPVAAEPVVSTVAAVVDVVSELPRVEVPPLDPPPLDVPPIQAPSINPAALDPPSVELPAAELPTLAPPALDLPTIAPVSPPPAVAGQLNTVWVDESLVGSGPGEVTAGAAGAARVDVVVQAVDPPSGGLGADTLVDASVGAAGPSGRSGSTVLTDHTATGDGASVHVSTSFDAGSVTLSPAGAGGLEAGISGGVNVEASSGGGQLESNGSTGASLSFDAGSSGGGSDSGSGGSLSVSVSVDAGSGGGGDGGGGGDSGGGVSAGGISVSLP